MTEERPVIRRKHLGSSGPSDISFFLNDCAEVKLIGTKACTKEGEANPYTEKSQSETGFLEVKVKLNTFDIGVAFSEAFGACASNLQSRVST